MARAASAAVVRLGLVVGLAVTSACGSTEKQPRTAHLSAESSTVRRGLQGKWRLVEINGRAAGGYLIFGSGDYMVSSDCNYIFGDYELSGNLVVAKGATSSLMECKGEYDRRRTSPDFVVGGRYRVWIGASELVLFAAGTSRSKWARYARMTPHEWRTFGRERPKN